MSKKGYSAMDNSGKTVYDLNSYVVDTEADLLNVPINNAPGSTCIVVETSDVYMLNTDKKWKKL